MNNISRDASMLASCMLKSYRRPRDWNGMLDLSIRVQKMLHKHY